jgi:hypothetical protein
MSVCHRYIQFDFLLKNFTECLLQSTYLQSTAEDFFRSNTNSLKYDTFSFGLRNVYEWFELSGRFERNTKPIQVLGFSKYK